ncbi:MAG: GTP-binding protein [Opitutales bacterium]|nr:GTP-binding protein [Opitutales bacterium]
MSSRASRIPVTVISGFLGSGKTTLLNHLLKHPGSRRIAVLVNDLGEVNIDASLLKAGATQLENDTLNMVELTNGCICCTIQDDFSKALLEMIGNGEIDHIVIESTGVAEPSAIIPAFMDDRPYSNPLGRKAKIDSLITLVDAASFYEHWKKSDQSDRTLGREQPLFDLMLEQAEYADILLINKTDLVSEDESKQLEGILHEINPRARLIKTTQSTVDTEAILSAGLFDLDNTMGAPRWISEIEKHIQHKEHEHHHHHEEGCTCGHHHEHDEDCPEHPHHHDHNSKYGLSTFLYASREPFNYEKLSEFLRNYPRNIVRAKGFCWVKKWNDEVGLLSIAGKSSSVEFMGEWWAAKLERGAVSEFDLPEIVRQAWKAPHGDRRQELVFIGVHMDEADIRKQLDACLL